MKKGSLELRCEELARKIVKFNGFCLRCRRKFPEVSLEWAHIISRGAERIKFDLDNCFCLCSSCHRFFTVNPRTFQIFVSNLLGEEKYYELQRRSHRDTFDAKIDLEATLRYLQEEYNKIKLIPKYTHSSYYHGVSMRDLMNLNLN